MRKMFLFLLMSLIIVFCLLTTPLVSMANVRVEVTSGTGPGTACPFYARIEHGQMGVIHTDEWAAIPFYRNPECVPKDFNLLDFFDIPRVWECESFMAGHEVWKNPDIDAAPIQSELKAVGPMPIYFVSWEVLQEALKDDKLTVPELKGLPTVQIGIATFYTETLHPSGGASQQVMISIVAHGYMVKDSNVQFELKCIWTHDDPAHGHDRIEFKTAKAAPSLRSQSKLTTTWGEIKARN